MIEANMGTHNVEVCEMRPTDDGLGRKSTKVAERTAEVEMIIDREKLAMYCRRAVGNKKGTSQLANGAIVFRVINGTLSERKLI